MQSLDLALTVDQFLFGTVPCLLVAWIALLKGIRKSFIPPLFVICAITSWFLTVLHEVGHIAAAEYFGLEVVSFEGTWRGYQITTNPPVYLAPPTAQAGSAIAGPAVEAVVTLVILLILRYSKNRGVRLVSAYLLIGTVLGGIALLFFPFIGGDGGNFFQGIRRLIGPSADRMLMLYPPILILLSVSVIRKFHYTVVKL